MGIKLSNFEFKKNNFDLIRLVAALQVVFIHGHRHFEIEGGIWATNVLALFSGVPIFFVVSGFLISASIERNFSLTSYAKNRVLRIFPALWACFFFTVITIFVFYDPKFSSSEFAAWVLSQITVVQFFHPDFLRGYGVGVVNASL